MSVSVCLSVCVRLHISKRPPHIDTSRNFLYLLPVAVAQSSSDDTPITYLLPVLWMTLCLSIMGYIWRVARAYSENDSLEGSTGAKSGVCDCVVTVSVGCV